MRRELTIALRAPVTWVVAALSALLVGHGFVLAVDLYSASSRSALLSQLQVREMDPLAGIVRPTLGGLDLAISILVPLVAVRALAAEKERRTFGALCLQVGSPQRVISRKFVASLVATAPLVACPVPLAPLVLVGCAVGPCGPHYVHASKGGACACPIAARVARSGARLVLTLRATT